jgi:hypothetical protein
MKELHNSEASLTIYQSNLHNITEDIDVYKLLRRFVEARGGAVVEALRYKSEGSGIDSRW